MHTTRTPYILDRSFPEIEPQSRLSWLLEANACEAHRRRLFPGTDEEEQMLSMRRPLSARRAYALFGLLLGGLPPAAIFIRMFGYGLTPSFAGDAPFIFIMCVVMNIVCCLTGRAIASAFSRTLDDMKRWSWSKMLLILPLIGIVWGGVTGTAGGLVFFGFGAFFGVACAVPVGIASFTLFAPLHRLLARGGMIDARHFWPLACGITTIISALILGM